MTLACTRDTPAAGVVVAQPTRGYRYAADVFLLLGVALADGVPESSLDLGTGCGVIPLLLARLGAKAVGVEAQHGWTPFWEVSVEASSVAVDLRHLRVQALDGHERFALITCNPPFSPANTGPVSPDVLKAAAHTELDGTLADFVDAAARCRAPEGRVAFIVPRSRADELAVLYSKAGLAVARRVDIGDRRSVLVGGSGPTTPIVTAIAARGTHVDALYARVRG